MKSNECLGWMTDGSNWGRGGRSETPMRKIGNWGGGGVMWGECISL